MYGRAILEKIHIEDLVKKDISALADVVVGVNGHIYGNVECINLDVAGKITGNIYCHTIKLQNTSYIQGNIVGLKIEFEPGARFMGLFKVRT